MIAMLGNPGRALAYTQTMLNVSIKVDKYHCCTKTLIVCNILRNYLIIFIFTIEYLYSKYVETFKATGCPNPNIHLSLYLYWTKNTDEEISKDMMLYCTDLRDKKSNDPTRVQTQSNICCSSEYCVPTKCNLQTKWSVGKHHEPQ